MSGADAGLGCWRLSCRVVCSPCRSTQVRLGRWRSSRPFRCSSTRCAHHAHGPWRWRPSRRGCSRCRAWSTSTTYLPLPVRLAAVAMFALNFMAVVLLTRWTAGVAPAGLAVFAYPLLLVTTEFLFGLASPNGSLGAMGYSLVDVLPLLQVASVGGMSALSFCIALPPSVCAVALVRPRTWRTVAVAGLAPLLLALAFGGLRLAQGFEATARVGLVGLDTREARAYRSPEQDLQTARAFAGEVRKLESAKPDFIVLPEKQLGGGRDASGSGAVLAEAASRGGATVVVGFDEVLPDGRRVNSAHVLAAAQPVRRYFKRHMIPGLETTYAPDPHHGSKAYSASPSARIWTFPPPFANTVGARCNCCWCRPGMSCVTGACIRAWPWCAASRMASPWRAPRPPAGSPPVIASVASLLRRSRRPRTP